MTMPRLAVRRQITDLMKTPARAARYEIADSVISGLRLVVQPSGHRSFVYRYTSGGQYRKLTLQADAIKAARIEAGKAMETIAAGVDPCAAKKRGADPDGTVTAAVARYTERHVQNLRPGTACYVRRELAAITEAWGNRQLSTIGKRDVIALIDDAAKRGANAANARHKTVAALLRWCANRAEIEASPAAGISRDKVVSRDRVLNDAEIAVVWKAADAAGGPPGALAKLLLLTAARRTEISALQWPELHADAIRLPASRVKTNNDHVIPLTPAMHAILDPLPRVGRYVLTGGDFPISTGSRAKDAIKTPTLAPWTMHDLRRSVATGMAELKVQPHVIELCLNHMPRGVAAIYNRARYATEIKAAFELWSDHIETITK
jgi:integrase